jgi:hypothetical protein
MRTMQRAGLITGSGFFTRWVALPSCESRCDRTHRPLAALMRSRVGRVRHAAAALVILLLSAVPVNAQILERAIDLSNGAALVAHSADLATTTFCLASETCVESNPLLLPHIKSPKTFFAIKMGTALTSYYIKSRTKRDHPKLTLLFGIGETVAFSLIAAHNNRVHERAAR